MEWGRRSVGRAIRCDNATTKSDRAKREMEGTNVPSAECRAECEGKLKKEGRKEGKEKRLKDKTKCEERLREVQNLKSREREFGQLCFCYLCLVTMLFDQALYADKYFRHAEPIPSMLCCIV